MKPKHVAIIPDGNRRWAKKNKIAAFLAHKKPASKEHLTKLFEAAKKEGINVLSIWAFSTENWNREKKEIEELFNVINKALDDCLQEKKDYFFTIIGRRDRIPPSTKMKIEQLEKKFTKLPGRTHIIIGIDYGGRDELIRATNKAITNKQKVTEETFKELLDTTNLPEPDLLIRTGGEKRLSGFMPYQTVYTEIIFTETLFPEFTPKKLKQCIQEYQKRQRRYGK